MRLISHSRVVDILGVGFDDVTLDESVDAIISHTKDGGEFAAVFTPNSEIVQNCVEDKTGELYKIINSASLIIPDSVGIIKASKIFKTPLRCKVPGIEVGEMVLKGSAERDIPVFFLGGKPGVAEAARERMTEKYRGLRVVGCRDGYFDKSGIERDEVIERIAASGAEILFVCLGAPAQEKWIYDNSAALSRTNVRCALALGGSLDIYAGASKRAPKIFITLGLEWFYRLLREPSRIRRMTALPRFYIECRRAAKKQRGGMR